MAEQTERRGERAAERGKAVAAEMRAKAGELVDSARSRAGNAQAVLADRLEASAEAIRERVAGPSDGAVSDVAEPATRHEPRIAQAGTVVAERMDRTAMWLRETDLTDLAALLRRELRSRPARTALIALGIGILIGRAISLAPRPTSRR